MFSFLLKRIGELLLTLLLLSLLVFMSVYATGDPARVLAGNDPLITGNPVAYAALKARWGFDEPIPVQYIRFLGSVVTAFDFGTSIVFNRPVRDIVFERAPYTLVLAVVAMLTAVLIGVPAGVVSALRRDSPVDTTLRAIAVTSLAAPRFWLASMMILLFAATLHWLPAFGAGRPEDMVLPTLVLAMPVAAGIMRLTRSSMLEVLESDYVRFARSKGLPERMIMWKHALRNAAIPVVTFGGMSLASLLNGSIVVEVIFGWPGLGQLLIQAVLQRDVALVVATTLLAASSYVVCSFVVDLAYGYMDPRIRPSRI